MGQRLPGIPLYFISILAAMSFMKKHWPYVFLAATAFLLYANTLTHDYALDDYSAIVENRIVKKRAEAIPEIFATPYRAGYRAAAGNLYRPLPLSMFAVEHHYFGNQAAGHHVVNVLLYVLLAVLLFSLLKKWLVRQHALLPFVIALLFVLHPIHTEVVANIKSRDELLAFIFMLGLFHALHIYLYRQKKWAYGAALLCFALALFSKESAVALIGVIPLVLYFFYYKQAKPITFLTLPFIVPLAGFLLARHYALSIETTVTSREGSWLMAQSQPLAHLASSIRFMGLYLYKMLIPYPLVSDYSHPQFEQLSWASWQVWLSLLLYATGIGFAFKGWKTRKVWSFAILFFLITHFLHSNLLFVIGTVFGERLLFTPSLGIIMLMGLGFAYWWEKAGLTGNFAPMSAPKAIAPLLMLAVLYAGLSFRRNAEWNNNRTLYAADVKKHPDSPLLNYWHGLELIDSQWLQKLSPEQKKASLLQGIAAFEKATALKPRYGDAFAQLGLAYYKLNQYEQALPYFEQALSLGKGSAETLNNAAAIYFARGNFSKARDYYAQAIRIDHYYVDAIGNLAATYGALGEFETALAYFEQALRLSPENASYLYYTGLTLNQLGRTAEAQPYFEKAFALNPSLRPKD